MLQRFQSTAYNLSISVCLRLGVVRGSVAPREGQVHTPTPPSALPLKTPQPRFQNLTKTFWRWLGNGSLEVVGGIVLGLVRLGAISSYN